MASSGPRCPPLKLRYLGGGPVEANLYQVEDVKDLRKRVANANNVLPDEVKLLYAETEEELPDDGWIADLLGSSDELDVQVVITTPEETLLKQRLSKRSGVSCFEDMKTKESLTIPYCKPDHMRDYAAVGDDPELATQLDHLPDGIGDLTMLKKLNMGGHQLRHLPQAIGDLCHLKELTLYRNKLQSLPESVGRLSSLLVLNLEENQFQHFPESFEKLTQLSKLNLKKNRVREIPESIGGLVALTDIQLEANLLDKLPENFGSLVNLKTLNLEKNRLSTLPESFANLASLEDLNLRSNSFLSLPDTVTRLGSLGCLDLCQNNLERLPDNFGELRKLCSLWLLDNRDLQELPDSFPRLLALSDLRFDINTVKPEWRCDIVRLLPKNLHDPSRQFEKYKQSTGCCPFRCGAKKLQQELDLRKSARQSVRRSTATSASCSRVSTASVESLHWTTAGSYDLLNQSIHEQRMEILQRQEGVGDVQAPTEKNSSAITFSKSVKASDSERASSASDIRGPANVGRTTI